MTRNQISPDSPIVKAVVLYLLHYNWREITEKTGVDPKTISDTMSPHGKRFRPIAGELSSLGPEEFVRKYRK